jgi:hypothetical protein
MAAAKRARDGVVGNGGICWRKDVSGGEGAAPLARRIDMPAKRNNGAKSGGWPAAIDMQPAAAAYGVAERRRARQSVRLRGYRTMPLPSGQCYLCYYK